MAITLPARPALPGTPSLLLPEGLLDPGLPVLDTTTGGVVEGHHWLCAYYGRTHFSEHWANRVTAPVTVPGLVEDTTGGWLTVLEYLVTPRSPGLGLTFRWLVSSTAGYSIRFAVGGAAAVSAWGAGGTFYGTTALVFAAPLADTLSVVQVDLASAAGAPDYATIISLSCHDTDLTAGTLP